MLSVVSDSNASEMPTSVSTFQSRAESKSGCFEIHTLNGEKIVDDEDEACQLDLTNNQISVGTLQERSATDAVDGPSFSDKEADALLRQLQTNSETYALVTSHEGMYGENKVSSLLFLFRGKLLFIHNIGKLMFLFLNVCQCWRNISL